MVKVVQYWRCQATIILAVISILNSIEQYWTNIGKDYGHHISSSGNIAFLTWLVKNRWLYAVVLTAAKSLVGHSSRGRFNICASLSMLQLTINYNNTIVVHQMILDCEESLYFWR
ncbi:hypothetical protein OS493_036875 [Desmophyllum pertusum]|uniref:Uncharacterized protein n=1 Tax=Desmophyllum pertusum TaxID=174260 RepID=A0A9W9Z6J0_9CNID|nr:hypothetical protein OS493_036875 [Desmophyllum pertusum]